MSKIALSKRTRPGRVAVTLILGCLFVIGSCAMGGWLAVTRSRAKGYVVWTWLILFEGTLLGVFVWSILSNQSLSPPTPSPTTHGCVTDVTCKSHSPLHTLESSQP